MNSGNVYAQKVQLLLRLVPLLMEEGVFAVHGGTAINLFLKDLPRYSVDIDLTYCPLSDRTTALADINRRLASVADRARRAFRGMHIVHSADACKLLCEHQGRQVKVEVNKTKRGLVGGLPQRLPLCARAQREFGLYCEADVVPLTLLYGGKIAAALSRQHPRDLFDVSRMDVPLADCREGLIFCLLGSDRPIHESFAPNLLDQRRALAGQFEGMTEAAFTYQDFEATRRRLIADVRALMTERDRRFLLSFESGRPQWDGYEFARFKDYPSIHMEAAEPRNLGETEPHEAHAGGRAPAARP